MAVYMLDPDISSYSMKRSHDAVLKKLQKVSIGVVCISVITKSVCHVLADFQSAHCHCFLAPPTKGARFACSRA